MYRILVLLLIVIPALEIGVLVLSSNYIGIPITILLVILTGIIGAWLAKKEGIHTLRVAQLQLQNGEIPSGVIVDGLCILVGGVLLLTPGFITDGIGFYLLIPYTRSTIKALLIRVFQRLFKNGNFVFISRR
ncbi:FxsA family protein [Bacillus alkalicellulosilyticus]|uniref:FxsA family protein n=1 Tax=Alkalihalobacterium alkalicellulosilyticum TaxID=1912214 RepID=UPI0009981E12|nr:FxsA family protein [Bacillus alkalicellulosilyticus]